MASFDEYEVAYGSERKSKIFYLAAGPLDGPLLIFIHGWPAIAKTWKAQMTTFASLGFRAVAPDMPGYGQSTVTRDAQDYSQENINRGMLALIDDIGREQAIWIGHDWGSGAVWTFAAHYPERCTGIVSLTVPYRTLELGLEELLRLVNRERYPEDKYPYGQWSYMKFYEEHFEKATAWFEKDIASFIRAGYAKRNPSMLGMPAFTATVMKDGGWFGGIAEPDPNWRHIPIDSLSIDEETYSEVVTSLVNTGMWGADAWYANHQRNSEYTLQKSKNDGYLHIPVLFIGARFDNICDTVTSRLVDPMREYCMNLTECCIDAGHWVAQERSEEVNAAITRWIIEDCKTSWPTFYSIPLVHKM